MSSQSPHPCKDKIKITIFLFDVSLPACIGPMLQIGLLVNFGAGLVRAE